MPVARTVSDARFVRDLLLGLCLVTAGAGAAEPAKRAERLLGQVSEAAKQLDYRGEFIYVHGGGLDVMRIVHRSTAHGEAERLVSLSGPAREVIRDGTRVTCTFADEREVLVEQRQPSDFMSLALSEPVSKIERHYVIALAGKDRVADRDTHVLTITPKANDRYSHRLWIDEASNLLLRSAVIGEGGRVLEQVVFTRVQIGGEIPPAALKPRFAGEGYTWFTNREGGTGAKELEKRDFTVAWVPSGFALKDQHTQELATSRKPVRHVAFSDGLAMVSVFVEEIAGEEPPLQGFSTLGAVNAFSRAEGEHQITVVGEVPQGVARRIAASVSISQAH